MFPKTGHKTVEGGKASNESLDILDIPDRPNLVMAEILSGFASMLRLVMMYPRSLPRGTQRCIF
jgi:hypothetical protein